MQAVHTHPAGADATTLKSALINLLGVAESTYSTSPIVTALESEGVVGFLGDFLTLAPEDIDGLESPPASGLVNVDPWVPLPKTSKRKLKILIAYYHFGSRRKGGGIDMTQVSKKGFDIFRCTEYDPSEPIVPWKTALKKSSDINTWKKTLRPNTNDFIQHRSDEFWPRTRERYRTTLQAMDLEDLIKKGFQPLEPILYALQMKWLYKVFQDKLQSPVTKSIVTKYIDTKDTRLLWEELEAKVGNSMTADIQSTKISEYLTTIRLDSGTWKGAQENFLLHFKEQARLYNELVEPSEQYSEQIFIKFLHLAVSGTPNLATVLNTQYAARSAAGVTTKMSFSEYVSFLQSQAQIYDMSHRTSNPRL